MPADLYFSNAETQAVQLVAGVIAQPTIYNLGVAEDIFNTPHRDIFEEFFGDELGASVSGSYTQGVSTGFVLSTGDGSTSGYGNSNTSKIWLPKPIAVSTVEQHSDERVHAPHRQDNIKLNYWKVLFSAESGQPTWAMLSVKNFPDFSPNPPGWWVDPTL